MTKCAFRYCKNTPSRSLRRTKGVAYFRFPRDPFKCAEWISVVAQQRCQEIYMPNNTSVVCSEHFTGSDMYETEEGVKLNDAAVPCVDLPDDESIVEINSDASSKSEHSKNAVATGSSSTADNNGPNIIEVDTIRESVETKEAFNKMKTMNTEINNTMDIVSSHQPADAGQAVDTGEVVDTIEPINGIEITISKVVNEIKQNDPNESENTNKIDDMIVNTEKPVDTTDGPPNTNEELNTNDSDDTMEVMDTEEGEGGKLVIATNSPAASTLMNDNDVLQATIKELNKKLAEKTNTINSLHKRNDRLNKRVDILKKELKSANKRIQRDTTIGQNLCKTLFFRYVRNYEHLYRQADTHEGMDDTEDNDDNES